MDLNFENYPSIVTLFITLLTKSHDALSAQKAQYPLIKQYGLNYIGLHIMI